MPRTYSRGHAIEIDETSNEIDSQGRRRKEIISEGVEQTCR